MKVILNALLISLFASVVYAEPFLVCDDPPAEEQVTAYEVFMDGVSLGTTPAPLRFDLQGITPGAYSFTATAINAWGASQPSDPYVSPQTVAQPSSLSMQP